MTGEHPPSYNELFLQCPEEDYSSYPPSEQQASSSAVELEKLAVLLATQYGEDADQVLVALERNEILSRILREMHGLQKEGKRRGRPAADDWQKVRDFLQAQSAKQREPDRSMSDIYHAIGRTRQPRPLGEENMRKRCRKGKELLNFWFEDLTTSSVK